MQLKNLTVTDSGLYRCVLNTSKFEPPRELDIQLDVIESGFAPNFVDNFTYDFMSCCRQRGVSDACIVPCNLRKSRTLAYDPVKCSQDMPKFLSCATEGGNISHLHCCKLQLVPPFCWDFCTGNMPQLLNQHFFCFYWFQEILQCYERSTCKGQDCTNTIAMIFTCKFEKKSHRNLTFQYRFPIHRTVFKQTPLINQKSKCAGSHPPERTKTFSSIPSITEKYHKFHSCRNFYIIYSRLIIFHIEIYGPTLGKSGRSSSVFKEKGAR